MLGSEDITTPYDTIFVGPQWTYSLNMDPNKLPDHYNIEFWTPRGKEYYEKYECHKNT